MMSAKYRFLLVCLAAISIALSGFAESQAQPQRQRARAKVSKRKRSASQRYDASRYMHPCYKLDAMLEDSHMPLNFNASNEQWDQPGGVGSQMTITYSYSNILDGDLIGISPDQIRAATEEAMALWASVAPINFVEISDVGPTPTSSESNYATGDSADIRIGTHVMDGASGGELAHAYLPYNPNAGLAGDVHFDIDEDWSLDNGGFFLETMVHELGHSLGLDHVDDVEAIMNPVIMSRYSGLGEAFLLEDDIDGIQSVYGFGEGTVAPLDDTQDPVDEEPTDEEPEEEEPEEEPEEEQPANDMVVEVDEESGLLTIQGDSADNEFLIYSNRWFTIVMGYNGTTVNGENGMYWMIRGDKSIEVTTSAGDDMVFFYGTSAESANVDLGAGDDSLIMMFSDIETATADGGEGEDSLLKFFNRVDELNDSGFESSW